jgi:hypothetical protein
MSSSRSAGLPARRRGMPSRALVVDANILVRAVLGKRVRYSRLMPEMYRSLSRNPLMPKPKNTWRRLSSSAAVIRKRRSRCCAPWAVWWNGLEARSMESSKLKRANGWPGGIPKIGRCWPLPSPLAVQSGRKTLIFSAVVSPRGRPTASGCSCRNDLQHLFRRGQNSSLLSRMFNWK